MKLLTLACLAVVATFASVTHASENWKYGSDGHGRVGFKHWYKANATCAGKRQSPIDISIDAASEGADLPLHLSGACRHFNVTQKYDSFKAEVQGGSCAVEYFGKNFKFAQVHFHSPSEHKLNHKAFDAETHFVHQALDGQIVVIGVFLERSDKGSTSPFFTKFFEALGNVDEQTPVPAKLGSFHAAVKELLTTGRVFNYPGGLTVPPCSEVVNWWVVETPLKISSSDYEVITKSLERIAAAENGRNARPTQALHGRKVTMY